MSQYSFRAECRHDVEQFLARAAALGVSITADVLPHGEGFPDVKVDMVTSVDDIERLRMIMKLVQDGHVMYQTLRPVPLAQNSLERDYNIMPIYKV